MIVEILLIGAFFYVTCIVFKLIGWGLEWLRSGG